MKVLSLSGYFRLPDGFDASDVKGAINMLAKYWLGPDPEGVEAVLPADIPKRPGRQESDEMWAEFIGTVFKGGRVFFIAGVENVGIDNVPEMIE